MPLKRAKAVQLASEDVHVRLVAAWLAVEQGAPPETIDRALARVAAADPDRGPGLVAVHPVLGAYATGQLDGTSGS